MNVKNATIGMSAATGQATAAPTNPASRTSRLFALMAMLLTGNATTTQSAKLNQAGNGKRVVKVLSSIGIGVVILNEIFGIGALNNSSGMFSPVVDSIGTTGVAALTLLVVGLVAYAGAVALGYLDMF